jgi:hypothetical protein
MTGLPELNFPAFHAATATLRAQGHEVVNPAEINPDTTMAWHACMRRDIAELVTCDAIHLLDGWQNSKGATLEHHIAERLGLVITEDKSGNFAAVDPDQVRLTRTQVEAFAHRRATTYTHRSNPEYHSYAFVPHTLMDFVGDVENALRGAL